MYKIKLNFKELPHELVTAPNALRMSLRLRGRGRIESLET